MAKKNVWGLACENLIKHSRLWLWLAPDPPEQLIVVLFGPVGVLLRDW